MVATPRLGIEEIDPGETQGYTSANEAFRQLDALVQTTVISRSIATPPGAPLEGDMYIVAASPTGLWVGHATHFAEWIGGVWAFYAPEEGWRAGCKDETTVLWFNGTAWTSLVTSSSGSSRNLDATGAAPSTGDVPAGFVTVRFTGGQLALWVNDAGVMKSLVLGTPA